MNKKPNRVPSAGAKDDSEQKDKHLTAHPNRSNTVVIGSGGKLENDF